MGYTENQIEQARQRQLTVARLNGEGRLMKGGERHAQVDPVLYHQARILNQRDMGVQDCWKEPEFVADMKRRHPEIAVRNAGKCRVMVGGWEVRGKGWEVRGEGSGVKRLTRFGRVGFHKVYGE